MIDPRFAILAAVITLAGSASYAWATVRGRTQPNRVTWSLWTLAPMIAFAAELAQGVGVQAVLTFAVGFGPLLVVAASFLDPKAYASLTRLDLACGGLSVVALIGWALTGAGDIAIAFSILADLFAAIPTVRKAYLRPATESAAAFLAMGLGAVVTLLTIKPDQWSFATAAFPMYIVVVTSVIGALVLRPGRAVGSSVS